MTRRTSSCAPMAASPSLISGLQDELQLHPNSRHSQRYHLAKRAGQGHYCPLATTSDDGLMRLLIRRFRVRIPRGAPKSNLHSRATVRIHPPRRRTDNMVASETDVSGHRRPAKSLSTHRLVVLEGIEDQAPERSSVEPDDLDVATVYEHRDAPSLLCASDADVVQTPAVTKRHRPRLVHLVQPQQSAFGSDDSTTRKCLMPGVINRRRRLSADASSQTHRIVVLEEAPASP
jgi:hypothetical protein